MKDIYVRDIIREGKGKLICGNEDEICINFSKDTRTIEKGDIYLGIKGEKINGNIFYEEALRKGAKGCILQDIKISEEKIKEYNGKFIIIVKNVVETLQKLAAYKRSLYDIPVIGITGSVGKTSTKDIIASVLSQKYNVLKSEGNYNNQIGLPLSILRLKDHDAMVLEMGMSSLGEIRLLTTIAKPSTAVITMIGSSHIGKLGSRENILKAKLEILEGLDAHGSLIINNDNDLLCSWNKNNNDNHEHITYGIENKSIIMAKDIKIKDESSSFKFDYNDNTYEVIVPVSGKHFVYNSLAAICVGIKYSIPIEQIIKKIEEFNLTKSRMEIIKTKENITIINDCYNASYESIKAALEYMGSLKANKKIAILGDVFELGEFSQSMHEKIGEEVYKNKIDILITVGKEAKNIGNKAIALGMNKENVYECSNNEEVINKIKQIEEREDVILVKASNGMHFDKIVEGII